MSKATHIRVTLSRELTWAEREELADFLTYFTAILGSSYNKGTDTNEPKLNVYGQIGSDSRELWRLVHNSLATNFVNVFPRSVHTVYPKVKV